MRSQASGSSIMSAWTGSRPERTSSSNALSRLVESLPSDQMTGFSSSTSLSHTGAARAGSRASIAFRFPHSVLISPLCASSRNGCASGQLGSVFVEYRWWNTAMPVSNSGDRKSA